MTENPTHNPPPTGFFGSVRRLATWRTEDRWVSGVAAGTAHRLGIDPVIVRGLFVVTSIFGGLGLLLYGLAWALLPEASDGRIHLEEAIRGHFDVALVGAALVFLLGMGNPVLWWDASFGWSMSWLIAVGAVVGLVLLVRNQRAAPDAGPPPPGARPGPPSPDSASPAPASRPTYSESTMPLTTATTADEPPRATPTADHPTTPVPTSTGTGTEQPAAEQPVAGGYNYGGPTTTAHATAAYGGGSHGTGGDGGGWSGGPPPGGSGGPAPAPVHQVPGPGSRLVSAVLALCLLTAAGLALADHTGALAGNVFLVAGGAILTLLGLGVLLSGILGRRQGALGALGIITAVIMVPAAAVAVSLPGVTRLGEEGWQVVGEHQFTPTTTQAADDGAAWGAGELVVDLTELEATEDVTVPVEVAFGSARIIVPDDGGVTVTADLGAGELTGDLGTDWSQTGEGRTWSSSPDRTIASGVNVDLSLTRAGSPHITVVTDVGFGQIIIEEQS